MMYRIVKVLNHNAFIGIRDRDKCKCLVMAKGIAFGKKTGENVSAGEDARVYSLKELTERGSAEEIIRSVPPECLELAGEILDRAEKEFGQIDRSILFPMTDHLAFAVQRIRNREQISNPLTEDIRILFHQEYKVAQCMEQLLRERLHVEIDEHEIGYIALHVHAAIEDQKVSQAMQLTRAVRDCISLVEKQTGTTIDVMSLSYNRLMNHIRYMVARALGGEKLKVNMNDYISIRFPKAFEMAAQVCEEMEKNLKLRLNDVEIGYLAMHLERVMDTERKEDTQGTF